MRCRRGGKGATPAKLGFFASEEATVNLGPKYALSLRSKALHVSGLGLFDVPPHIFGLKHVTRLDLGFNELRSLSKSVGQLVNLEELWLNDNPIREVPGELHLCSKLKVLDLKSTALTQLAPELGRLSLREIDVTGTPFAASLDYYKGPDDTAKLVDRLDVQDKRLLLRHDMLERSTTGIYREIANDPASKERIELLIEAVVDEFVDLQDLRNVVRNCDRLLPSDVNGKPKVVAAKLRDKYESLKRDNDKKRLAAELELKMRALYYDKVDPAKVEGYIGTIYAAGNDKPLELEDVQFLIRHASRLFPNDPRDIDGRGVRDAVWALQRHLTDERAARVADVASALVATVYPDAEPLKVDALAVAVCDHFKRDRFATTKELDELKKLAADASLLFPAEFNSANPKKIRLQFKQRELELKQSSTNS